MSVSIFRTIGVDHNVIPFRSGASKLNPSRTRSLRLWQQPRLGREASRVLAHSLGRFSRRRANDHVGRIAFSGITGHNVFVCPGLTSRELSDSRVRESRLQRLKVRFLGDPSGNLIVVAQERPRLRAFGAVVSGADVRVGNGSPQSRIVADCGIVLSRGHGKQRNSSSLFPQRQ